MQLQLNEIDSAIEELGKTDKAYKIISNIMVAVKIPKLKNDLQSRKEVVELRVKTMEKQEKSLKAKATSLQSKVLEQIQGSGD